jgi:lysophospholipase L1-like esterase
VLKKTALLLFAAMAAARILAGDFLIHDGERVVFLGDSITEQRLYTTYIEAYALTRHPDWKLSFRNAGWGGDTAWLRQRTHANEDQLYAANDADQQKIVDDAVGRGLARDVLPLKPTFVTVKFGMNDHAYQAFRPDIFRAYARSQAEIAKVLKENGARIAFLTPQPIEDKRADPDKDARNQSLRKFADGLKEVAAKEDAAFVDQFDPYMGIMLHARESSPTAVIGGGDAVHPGPTGHTVMAWIILKGIGATALVSRAEIDAGAQKVGATAGCKIDHVGVADGVLSFDRLDDALPLPIDERAENALKLAPILDELSQYELKVTGLSAAAYQVIVDGETAGKVAAEDLAKGWNLTLDSGPIAKQAREVLKLVFRKNDEYYNRWRNVQLYKFPSWAQAPELEARRTSELARLDQKVADIEAQIDAARKPKPHHFELKPAAQ